MKAQLVEVLEDEAGDLSLKFVGQLAVWRLFKHLLNDIVSKTVLSQIQKARNHILVEPQFKELEPLVELTNRTIAASKLLNLRPRLVQQNHDLFDYYDTVLIVTDQTEIVIARQSKQLLS